MLVSPFSGSLPIYDEKKATESFPLWLQIKKPWGLRPPMASRPGSERGSRVTASKAKIKEIEFYKTNHGITHLTKLNIFNQLCQGSFDISIKSL
jgi:hypothetical protein